MTGTGIGIDLLHDLVEVGLTGVSRLPGGRVDEVVRAIHLALR